MLRVSMELGELMENRWREGDEKRRGDEGDGMEGEGMKEKKMKKNVNIKSSEVQVSCYTQHSTQYTVHSTQYTVHSYKVMSSPPER